MAGRFEVNIDMERIPKGTLRKMQIRTGNRRAPLSVHGFKQIKKENSKTTFLTSNLFI